MRQAACVPGAGNLAQGAAWPARVARAGSSGRQHAVRLAGAGPAGIWVWPMIARGAGRQGPRARVVPGLACPMAQARPWIRYVRAATSAGDARAAGLRRAARAVRRSAAPSRHDGSLIPGCGGALTGGIPRGCSGGIGCSPAAHCFRTSWSLVTLVQGAAADHMMASRAGTGNRLAHLSGQCTTVFLDLRRQPVPHLASAGLPEPNSR